MATKNAVLWKPTLKTLKTKAKRKSKIQQTVDKKSSEGKGSNVNRQLMNLDHDYARKNCPVVVLRDIFLDSNAEYTQKKHDIQKKWSAVNVSKHVDYTQKEDESKDFRVMPNVFELNAGKGYSTDRSE